MYEKDVRIFLKDQAKERYLELNSSNKDKCILNSFERVKEILKENPQYGNPISKRLIPNTFKKIGIKRVYRVELANYWRLLYTIEGTDKEIFIFILCIMNHKEYNKLFGY